MHLTLAEIPVDVIRPPASRRSRRRVKLVRFLVCEITALIAILICARLAVAERFLNHAYNQLFATLLILATSAAAMIPVFFYGMPGRFSRRLR